MFNNEFYTREKHDLINALDELGVATLHAVVASVGGSLMVTSRNVDAMGVDAVCEFAGRFTDDDDDSRGFTVHVQLKSTARLEPVNTPNGSCFPVSVEVGKLRRYCAVSNVPLLFVLFVAPPFDKFERWVNVDAARVEIQRSLYWTSLDSGAIDYSKKTNTVYVPVDAVLTPEALLHEVAVRAATNRVYYD